MKKCFLIISLISAISVFASRDFYSSRLDSLETAFSQSDTLSIFRFSQMLIESDSSRSEGFYYRANYYFMKGNYSSSVSDALKSISISSTAEGYNILLLSLFRTNPSAYNSYVSKAYSEFPKDSRFMALKRDNLFNEHKYDSAYSIATMIQSSNPKDRRNNYILASILFERNEAGSAIKLISPVLSSPDALPEEILLCAKIYRVLKMTDKAAECYIDLTSTDYAYSSYLLASDCYVDMSMPDSASSLLLKMTKSFPDSSEPYLKLLALADAAGDTETAFIAFDRIAESELNNLRLYEYAGLYLFKIDRYKESSSFYKGIISMDSLYSSREAVQSFVFSGNYSDALVSLRRYINSNPQDTSFIYKYGGTVFFKNAMFDSSEAYYEKAFDINDRDTLLAANLANVYRRNKKDMKLMDLIDYIAKYNKPFADKLMGKYFGSNE